MKREHKINLALITLVAFFLAVGIKMEIKAQRPKGSTQHLYDTAPINNASYATKTAQWETEREKQKEAAERRKERREAELKEQQQREAKVFAADIAKGCNSTAKFQKVLWTWHLVVPGGGSRSVQTLFPHDKNKIIRIVENIGAGDPVDYANLLRYIGECP